MPIGSIIAYAGKETPENYLFCDGQTFNQSEYPDLYKVLGTNTTPKLNDNRFLEGADSYGTAKDAGLPNITAWWTTGGNNYNADEHNSNRVGNAVFGTTTQVKYSESGGDGGYDPVVYFNASKGDVGAITDINQSNYKNLATNSNSAYGKSDTVQPKSLTVRYIIRAK